MTTALEIRDLCKSYGDVRAVSHLDLVVNTGECFGLLGPNGAGKTTTIEICEGLLAPDSGAVEVLGMRWDREERELRNALGIQLQETQLSDKLTVSETVRLFRSFYARGLTVDEVIALVQLEEKARSRVGTLSGGQKQRLAVACALVGDPKVLFLDEPTTGLDPQSRRQLWELIERFRSHGRTVVLTTHYMDEAEHLCDRVAIVDQGRVIALDTPRALIASLGAEHVVGFTVEGDRSPDDDALRALAGVTAVRHENGATELTSTELRLTVPALLGHLEQQRLRLSELTTHSATLEDVFVSLTGRHLRDA
ncbi:MAG TPA: ABC transporter ATP-binding protein [Gemmatimonadaceae bacterium]|nr:ABC transporter ATP-binding protein [Gemmatimonadaceae bacterium]